MIPTENRVHRTRLPKLFISINRELSLVGLNDTYHAGPQY